MRVDVEDGFALHVVEFVYLDGESVICCMADEEKGKIEKYRKGPDGKLVKLAGTEENIRDAVFGVVVIVLHSDWEATDDGDYKFRGKQ